MPSTSKKQHNFMEMIAHDPKMAKKVGVPQSVGKDFVAADKGKKFGVGGNVNYTFGGKGQLNKQRTRGGSIDGYQKDVPDVNINKYAGKKAGGAIRTDLQVANKKKTDHGGTKLFKEGGIMKSDMKEDTKMDKVQDKAMLKKAFKQHDAQEHKGGKGTKLALKSGGMCGGGKAMKKMAKGGGCEVKGKTKGRMV
jgi:hypothetical protein